MTIIMGIICTANLSGSFTHTIAAFPTAPNDKMESPLTLMMMPTSFPFNHPQYSYTQPLCTLVSIANQPPMCWSRIAIHLTCSKALAVQNENEKNVTLTQVNIGRVEGAGSLS
ncbi:hypothetical protein F5J12DRAFT_927558 [Pisolithus orientalis]|uniref:uncharacterized protein n=1 Tax=Pisolithus orientalis TaxID=936130 RepID=UPI0022259AA1|nr:uncharacterized protein F5J12DRAFT_927558 [Pisolithus orientalis]KAI6006184.1 hypothetical protein F5J12DRAFT_927558 [Pisolithus orientalis]